MTRPLVWTVRVWRERERKPRIVEPVDNARDAIERTRRLAAHDNATLTELETAAGRLVWYESTPERLRTVAPSYRVTEDRHWPEADIVWCKRHGWRVERTMPDPGEPDPNDPRDQPDPCRLCVAERKLAKRQRDALREALRAEQRRRRGGRR